MTPLISSSEFSEVSLDLEIIENVLKEIVILKKEKQSSCTDCFFVLLALRFLFRSIKYQYTSIFLNLVIARLDLNHLVEIAVLAALIE